MPNRANKKTFFYLFLKLIQTHFIFSDNIHILLSIKSHNKQDTVYKYFYLMYR